MTYSFDNFTLPNVATIVAPLPSRIGQAETPGRPGGFAGRRYSGTRGITVAGVVKAAIGGTIDDAWSALCAAHDVLTPAPLIIRDGWYILALPENISESERQVENLQWEATYRAYSPYFLSTTLSSPSISISGGSFSVGGNAPAKPILTLSISNISLSNSITVQNTTTGEALTIAPDATGDWTIDSLAEKITCGGADRTDAMQGQYLSLAPGLTNTIAITCTAGTAISAASLSFRSRSV